MADIDLLIQQKDYEGIKLAIETGQIKANYTIFKNGQFLNIIDLINAQSEKHTLYSCHFRQKGMHYARLQSSETMDVFNIEIHNFIVPSYFTKYLIDKGLNIITNKCVKYIQSICLNINDDSLKNCEILLNLSPILMSMDYVSQCINEAILINLSVPTFNIAFFKSFIELLIKFGVKFNNSRCWQILHQVYRYISNLNISAIIILLEYCDCKTPKSIKFEIGGFIENNPYYIHYCDKLQQLTELIDIGVYGFIQKYGPIHQIELDRESIKTKIIDHSAIKNNLQYEILSNKDMTKLVDVIKNQYYDLLFELIYKIDVNMYIRVNGVYKTLLILACENYSSNRTFDKMLVLYLINLVNLANLNSPAYKQGIVEKIYDFNCTPIQLMMKHEDFDITNTMLEKGAILNLTKHFISVNGAGFCADFEMYLKLNIVNIPFDCPRLTMKDGKIKDLLVKHNCCGICVEKSLLLDANVE